MKRDLLSSRRVWATTTLVATACVAAGYYVLHLQRRRRKNEDINNSKTAASNDDGGKVQGRPSSVPASAANKTAPISEIHVQQGGQENQKQEQQQQKRQKRILSKGCITIVHGSMTGTCAKFSRQLYARLEQRLLVRATNNGGTTSSSSESPESGYRYVQVGSVEEWDWWDELLNDDDDDDDLSNDNNHNRTSNNSRSRDVLPPPLLVVLIPTYTAGTWPPAARSLETALQDLQHDWRIAKFPLRDKLKVAAFGTGSSAYNDHHDVQQQNGTAKTTTTAEEAAEHDDDANNKDKSGTLVANGGSKDASAEQRDDKKKKPPSSSFSNNMGQPAREASRQFSKLGARSLLKVQVGDDAVGNHAQDTFDEWQSQLLERIVSQRGHNNKNRRSGGVSGGKPNTKTTNDADQTSPNCCQEQQQGAGEGGCCKNTDNTKEDGTCSSHPRDGVGEEEAFEEDEEEDEENEGEPQVMDVEDMGDSILASTVTDTNDDVPREMVTPTQAAALKKEGYRLIGSHSAVKLCRWTKHQLRGRGGCYKHTFYGITSYQCMEATPSLACANKCVFCWRHHKNPVGKEWKWKTDDPGLIVERAVEEHVRMIKETKGIPGVRQDRWLEAHTVKHCALSLVGEPIMYPRIDELLGDLHGRDISTFLVTNGQHPEAIRRLRPVTQLYVSVDAPTRESLIAIDRPLFSDAWERLRQSLTYLKNKGQQQRTVARLTVVKGWNADEIEGYAQLIALGRVSLVEIKGVTYCGKSDASNLNMTNTPWHHEVVSLARNLMKEIDKLRQKQQQQHQQVGDDDDSATMIPEYGLACEHKHSLCVLLARADQFAAVDPVSGKRTWRTWIDYDKFHELASRHAADPSFTFDVKDYTEETPAWALFGSPEEGFDPTDTRHRKKKHFPMYTQFDERGVPTHDRNGQRIGDEESARLARLMEERVNEIGAGSTVTERRDGAKEILDPALMFRGMVVAKS